MSAAENAISEQGDAFAMADVAARAGFTRSAVYAMFRDKDDLVDEIVRRHTARIVEQMDAVVAGVGDARERTRALVDVLVGWADDDPTLALTLIPRMQSFTGETVAVADHVEALLAAGFTELGASTRPAASWSRALLGAVVGAVGWWARGRVRGRSTLGRDDLVDDLTALIWSGFAGAGGARLNFPPGEGP
ncbi:TetR/AcrR family transcriptional regulator [Gordonia soli]|nr:TetR/AcrR family transcriptional regulator [Gordonia soli]